MTQAEQLARYALDSEFSQLSPEAADALKMHLLDSLGCAIGALDGGPIDAIRKMYSEFSCPGPCTMIGFGTGSPERAAFFNSALVRYLDFMDNFMSPGETCHPADNLGSILAAAEYAGLEGRDFLAALATAYHIQCRVTSAAPVMGAGFDHTTQLSYSVAAGAARALGLTAAQAANAIGIAGTSLVSLAVTRTGLVPQWKGLAAAQTAVGAISAAFLARHGVTGPVDVIEGRHGFEEALGKRLNIEWPKEGREGILATSIKRYNAEVHSQSCIEGMIALCNEFQLTAADIERVNISIFRTAFDIIGGGKYGDRHTVHTKEQADHSLPYLLAVAILDRDVLPPQFEPARISSADVQTLMKRVYVKASRVYTSAYSEWMPCSIKILRKNGRIVSTWKVDYEGFYRRPMTWDRLWWKFDLLANRHADSSLRRDIVAAVRRLDMIPLRDLTSLLRNVC